MVSSLVTVTDLAIPKVACNVYGFLAFSSSDLPAYSLIY